MTDARPFDPFASCAVMAGHPMVYSRALDSCSYFLFFTRPRPRPPCAQVGGVALVWASCVSVVGG